MEHKPIHLKKTIKGQWVQCKLMECESGDRVRRIDVFSIVEFTATGETSEDPITKEKVMGVIDVHFPEL